MSEPQIVACVPSAERSSSQRVHLYLPNYVPTSGGKSVNRDRRLDGPGSFVWQHSMCGQVPVNEIHPGPRATGPEKPWKYEHRTLSEAQHMIRYGGYLWWCHLCIGHAVQVMGLPLEVVRMIAERQVSDGVAP